MNPKEILDLKFKLIELEKNSIIARQQSYQAFMLEKKRKEIDEKYKREEPYLDILFFVCLFLFAFSWFALIIYILR